MKLYHGTNIDFDIIDLTKSNKYKDFGQGFYLTDIHQQAKDLPPRKHVYLVEHLLFKHTNLTNRY